MNEELVSKLLNSKKYRDVCPDTIRRVLCACEERYKKPKDVERAAREALHGVTGAFLTPNEAALCLKDMRLWAAQGRGDALLEAAMSRHASTRERLPLARADETCARIFEATGRPETVLDLACGLNPLYLGARGIPTVGVDVSGEAVRAVNACREECALPVSAVCADLLCDGAIPQERFHLALLFKVLPLLERQQRGAAMETMRRVNARFLAVSFPTRTLGGRNVGMAENYAAWMEAHLPENRAIAARISTENELFYILKEN